MIDRGPLYEVLAVVGEGDPGPFATLGLLRLVPGVLPLDQRAPAGLTLGSAVALVTTVDRVRLHPANSLLMNMASSTGEPDSPVPSRVPIHAARCLVLFLRRPIASVVLRAFPLLRHALPPLLVCTAPRR